MIGEARNTSRRWTTITLVANFARNVASSIAESPPPTTTTVLSRKKAASQTAQYETPRPWSERSDSSPSWRAFAPVATITRLGPVLVVADPDPEGPLREVDLRHVVGDELGAEALGLLAEVLHHLRPEHAARVARVVLDVARDHELAAPVDPLDDQGLHVRSRGVESGGVSRRGPADHDDFAHVVRVHCASPRSNCLSALSLTITVGIVFQGVASRPAEETYRGVTGWHEPSRGTSFAISPGFEAENGFAISVYLDLDPSSVPTAGDAHTRLNSLLDGAAKENGGKARELTHQQKSRPARGPRADPPLLRRRVRAGRRARPRHLLRGPRQRLAPAAAHRGRARTESRSTSSSTWRPLVPLVGRGEGALVLVVSREQGRFYRLRAGRLEDLADYFEEQPRRHDQGGWPRHGCSGTRTSTSTST